MKKLRVSALLFGIIAAALGVCAQAIWAVHPPEAYGICLVCHGRDLVTTLLSNFDWYEGSSSVLGKRGLLLTSVLIPVGSFIAAVLFREFRLGFRENKFAAFFLGAGVMYCGLTVSGCPMRLLLRTGYGDFMALWLMAVVVFGVYIGTLILKRRAQKQ